MILLYLNWKTTPIALTSGQGDEQYDLQLQSHPDHWSGLWECLLR
jgi:hypothetical protein